MRLPPTPPEGRAENRRVELNLNPL
jgi:outer membrane protein OmpA-like peptidoglycan-associated protein